MVDALVLRVATVDLGPKKLWFDFLGIANPCVELGMKANNPKRGRYRGLENRQNRGMTAIYHQSTYFWA